jgi:RNA polymerase sigma-70 factor, ECF subfamily
VLSQADDLVETWRAMRGRLVAFVASRVPDQQNAEDIVQEVFIKLGKGIGGLRDEQRLQAWIYQVTRNAISDHHRALARAGQGEARAAADRSLTGPSADQQGVRAALTGCLAPLVSLLNEHDRQAIVLVEYDGLTQAEAARRLGLSISGMKSRVQRARARLRELLQGCCQVAIDARGDARLARPCSCACACHA